jgi:alpha-beta hydrolase superfamily lysophospholipase
MEARVRIVNEQVTDGIAERDFELEVAGERVPGVLWAPADAAGGHPLVLMGHGGSQHKRIDTLVARARRYVTELGFAVAAIDAPGHGERTTPEEAAARVEAIRQRIADRRPMDPEVIRDMVARTARAVPEWTATLDALQALDVVGTGGPVGYWGVSMGTAIGVPFVAASRASPPPSSDWPACCRATRPMAEAARAITIPVEFVLQSEDEIVSRPAGMALFDAFGSTEKTLHVNPGGHLGIPEFERASWERFFTRHLRGAVPARA